MAQFDLFRHARSKRYPFLLDIQTDLLRKQNRVLHATEGDHRVEPADRFADQTSRPTLWPWLVRRWVPRRASVGCHLPTAPRIVVVDPEDRPLDGDDRRSLESILAADYVVAARLSGREVYRRRSGP